MESVIISSNGFAVDNFRIEGFTLMKGDSISIDFPAPCDFRVENTLYEILSGERKIPGVSINSKVIPVITPTAKSRSIFFSKKSPIKYFEENSLLAKEKILSLLDEMSINSNVNIYQLGANEKKLLALEAAYSKSKNIIICTSDLDYIGVERVRSRVQKEINEGALLEINYSTSKGREYLFDKSQEYHKKVTKVLL